MPFTACQLMKEKYDLNNHENCILISSGKNWVEQAAVDQLRGVSRLPGMIRTVGLPDLHPGNTPGNGGFEPGKILSSFNW